VKRHNKKEEKKDDVSSTGEDGLELPGSKYLAEGEVYVGDQRKFLERPIEFFVPQARPSRGKREKTESEGGPSLSAACLAEKTRGGVEKRRISKRRKVGSRRSSGREEMEEGIVQGGGKGTTEEKKLAGKEAPTKCLYKEKPLILYVGGERSE